MGMVTVSGPQIDLVPRVEEIQLNTFPQEFELRS